VLIEKTFKAVEEFGAESLLLGGGVSANSKLREEFENRIIKNNLKVNLFVPEKYLCTDNGAMIAAAAFFQNDIKAWQKIDATPGLYFDQT
jgi:N6-L-threonylcarbamoyladenine synthase